MKSWGLNAAQSEEIFSSSFRDPNGAYKLFIEHDMKSIMRCTTGSSCSTRQKAGRGKAPQRMSQKTPKSSSLLGAEQECDAGVDKPTSLGDLKVMWESAYVAKGEIVTLWAQRAASAPTHEHLPPAGGRPGGHSKRGLSRLAPHQVVSGMVPYPREGRSSRG